MLERSIKRKKSISSPVALHHRKPLEFHESPKNKASNLPNPNDQIFKDNKIKDKLLGYVHKSRENKERMRSMANKVNKQLKLGGDSESSQDSDVEGYNEKPNQGDVKMMKAKNNLTLIKKSNIQRRKSNLQTEKDNIIPLLSYGGRVGRNEYVNPNLVAYNALLHSDQQKFIEKNANSEKTIEFITYITNMKQNSNLSKDSEITEEIKDSKKIVHIKTSDYFTFMRLEHEINEVIRKQKEFYELKKLYFEKKKASLDEKDDMAKIHESSQDRLKKTKDYQKGLNIAKRFIPAKKRKKEKTAIQIADQFITDTKKSTIISKNKRQSQVEN